MAGLTDIAIGNFTHIEYGAKDAALIVLTETGRCPNSVGDLTSESNIVEVAEFCQKFPRKLHGSGVTSPVEVVFNYDSSDLGQAEFIRAKTDEDVISIAVILDADDTGVDGVYFLFNTLVTNWSISSAFDEVRTITFTFTPVTDIGDPVSK